MNKKFPFKTAVVTGLISAVFAIGSFILLDSLNNKQNWGIQPDRLRGIIGLLTLVILGIGIYTGMKSIKRANAGQLTYGSAVLAGLTVGVITGLLMAVLGFVYYHFINPGFTAYMIEAGRKEMLAAGADDAQITYQTNALRQEYSPTGQAIQAIFGQSVCGLLISLVMAFFVKSKKAK